MKPRSNKLIEIMYITPDHFLIWQGFWSPDFQWLDPIFHLFCWGAQLFVGPEKVRRRDPDAGESCMEKYMPGFPEDITSIRRGKVRIIRNPFNEYVEYIIRIDEKFETSG